MKYFFLADGWTYGRIWEFGGLWNEATWRRSPQIKKLDLGMEENGEILWLHEVEEAVIMVEVKPEALESPASIGQVVLKRLISAEDAIAMLSQAAKLIKTSKSS